MTPQQIHFVRTTFATVEQDSPTFAASFYRRLFERDPTLRQMFHGDLTSQERKLMQAVRVVVGALECLPTLVPALQDLGRRHIEYGARDHHYDEVAAALLASLAHALGDRFTPEARVAWTCAYGLVSSAMKSGAKCASSPPLMQRLDDAELATPMLASPPPARIDSVTLHQRAREHRLRLIGDIIARAAAGAGAAIGRALAVLVPRSAKRRAHSDLFRSLL